MNINKINNSGTFSINEINQSVSKEELALLCQALESRSEKDQKMMDALQDLKRVLETEKPSSTKDAASGLLAKIGVDKLASVLGDSALTIIQKLAGM